MEWPCFEKLCKRIEGVGADEFKSKKYIKIIDREGQQTKRGKMYQASKFTTGDYISALTLRILAGGA